MKLGSEPAVFPFTFASRFEDGQETNPEELIGAAQAGCFSMFLAALLGGDGYPPTRIATSAKVHLEQGPTITTIELETTAEVANIDEATFLEYVENAKKNCPVSKALTGVEVRVAATLVG
jgi:osmotically inducible protein OsmC